MDAENVGGRTKWVYVALAVAAIIASLFLTRNVDLGVYWYGVNGFFAGKRPAYGPGSGIGFPLEYRYPPVTYLLLYPLRWASLRVAGFWWMLGACGMWMVAVSQAIRIRHLRFSRTAVVACCAFLLAYIELAVHYGNVQPWVIAWLFLSLVLSQRHPVWSGILLALGVTFKIWPVLFLPWFFPRPRRRAAGYFAIAMAVLWIAPVAVFGAAGYGKLLHDWYVAVGRVGTTYSEFYYFPGQSLRGILLRYLTPVTPPLATFPHINFLSIAPQTAVALWEVTSVLVYGFLVVQLLRSDSRALWAWDGLVFVLYSLVEPYAVKSGLISIAPAVITAACLYTLGTTGDLPDPPAQRRIRWANRLFLTACAISFAQAILQYKPLQRYLLSYGLDFWGNVLLLIASFIWIVGTPLPNSIDE